MSRMINDLSGVRMMVGMGVLTFVNTPLVLCLCAKLHALDECAADTRDAGAVCRAVCRDEEG